jgi:hypothetical protein
MDSKTKGKVISEVLMMMKMWLVVCWVVISFNLVGDY